MLMLSLVVSIYTSCFSNVFLCGNPYCGAYGAVFVQPGLAKLGRYPGPFRYKAKQLCFRLRQSLFFKGFCAAPYSYIISFFPYNALYAKRQKAALQHILAYFLFVICFIISLPLK